MSAPAKKFVIFTASRSGSTTFARALGSHRNVMCYQHPFSPDLHKFRLFNNIPKHKVDIASREDRPVDYIDDLFAHMRRRSCIGFKIWPLPDVPACEIAIRALAADESVKKIMLYRRNQLASYASRMLVREKRLNPEAFEPGAIAPKAQFKESDFLTFMKRRRDWFEMQQTLSRGDILNVPYETMMADGLAKSAKFLNLPEPHDFVEHAKKRNSNDILGRFDPNVQEAVLSVLDQIGHPEWVSEGT